MSGHSSYEPKTAIERWIDVRSKPQPYSKTGQTRLRAWSILGWEKTTSWPVCDGWLN